MRVKILSFAQLREALGSVLELELPEGASVATLQQALSARFPDLPALAVARVAVNRSYVVDPAQLLAASDEIALIPPVSGG
ncbi:MAG: MoaD/ThiS family protein [Candidatus Sericytochromatia bacterium]